MTTINDFSRYLMPTYKPWGFLPTHGKGVYLWDDSGKDYIDLTGGIAVSTLGHAPDVLIDAFTKQAHKLWHISNYGTCEPAIRLAQMLCEHTFADKVFFSNSGLEANEAALKLARRYAHTHFDATKHTIVAFKNAFHGRSLFTVTAGGTDAYKQGFGPLPGGFVHLDIDCSDEVLAQAINSECCAAIIEPIFGESGVIPVPIKRLKYIRELCTKSHALLIFDEIQTGIGRTGTLFYHQQIDVQPDILTSAKGLGGGLPIGATLTTDAIAQCFMPGVHGSTFGGNPITTAVARTVLEVVNSETTLKNIAQCHQQCADWFTKLNTQFDFFEPMRGVGLLIGWPLKQAWRQHSATLFALAMQHGVLCVPAAGGKVVRMAPSLLITEAEMDEAMGRLQSACAALQVQATTM